MSHAHDDLDVHEAMGWLVAAINDAFPGFIATEAERARHLPKLQRVLAEWAQRPNRLRPTIATEHDHEPLVAAAKVSKHDEALYMLRHLWSYEGHDLAEGVRQVEKYCRTVERRMRAAEFGRTTD